MIVLRDRLAVVPKFHKKDGPTPPALYIALLAWDGKTRNFRSEVASPPQIMYCLLVGDLVDTSVDIITEELDKSNQHLNYSATKAEYFRSAASTVPRNAQVEKTT